MVPLVARHLVWCRDCPTVARRVNIEMQVVVMVVKGSSLMSYGNKQQYYLQQKYLMKKNIKSKLQNRFEGN